MTVTTLTPEQREAIRHALSSPDLTIVSGLGSADIPGRGRACTIAEVNLVLTGRLTDGPHPCISDVIRRWVIAVQDAMPEDVRNSPAWRDAAIGIAGSVASPDVEARRTQICLDWMWDALADEAVLDAIPEAARPTWDRMLADRTVAAARAAAFDPAAFDPAAFDPAAFAAAAAAAVAAAVAAAAAADAVAAAVAVAAADAVAAAARAEFWGRRDPAGTLTRLIAAERG